MNIPILEQLREARVEKEAFEVEGIILASGISRNGTFYPPDVVERCAPVFIGVQCYADHPGPGEIERSVRDVVGLIEDAWADNGKIRARIRMSKTYDWLLTMIEEGLAGDLSINALGKTRVSRRDGRVVREVIEITRAHSVDFVARAAAGGKVEKILRESAAYDEGLRLIERMTPDELLAARPDLFESFMEMAHAQSPSENSRPGTDSVQLEIRELEDGLDRRLKALRHESIAIQLADSSRLPARVREFLLKEALLLKEESEDTWKAEVSALIERYRAFLADFQSAGLIKGMGAVSETAPDRSALSRETVRLMQ